MASMINTDDLKQIGRYQLREKLGEGAMGVVYRAFDPNLGIDVALKLLRVEMAENESFVQRFRQEAKVIARLTHSNIVNIYNMDEDDGLFYIAMTFLDGKPLDKYIHETRPDISRIIEIVVQVAEALDYAHKNKVIHRDIKPSNIIVSPDGQVILTDFGVAHFEDTPLAVKTLAGDSLGTPLYMAPEQFTGINVDGRSDLYALGIVIYEMTTGKLPFPPFDRNTKPMPPAEINPAIPKDLSRIIMKCLRQNPKKRVKSGKEMAEILKSVKMEVENRQVNEKWYEKGVNAVKEIAIISSLKKNNSRMWEKKSQRYILISGAALICSLIVFLFLMLSQFSNPKPTPPAPLSKGILKIDSIPPGAEIVIDDDIKGKASQNFELPVGAHEVRLSLDNFYEGNVVVLVDEGETSLQYRLFSVDRMQW